jgi:hypothetical protein
MTLSLFLVGSALLTGMASPPFHATSFVVTDQSPILLDEETSRAFALAVNSQGGFRKEWALEGSLDLYVLVQKQYGFYQAAIERDRSTRSSGFFSMRWGLT